MFKQSVNDHFLEEYNSYRDEIFSVYLTLNGLSNGISHIRLS